jgi:hypothetical protein
MRKPNRGLAAVAIVLALAVACTTAEGDAYKALGTASVAVDTAMKTYGKLVAAGKVSAATQALVKQDYADYQTTMLAAQAAVDIWKSSGGTAATFPTSQVNTALQAASNVQTATVMP